MSLRSGVDFDVIVVGAGPAGSAAAYALANAGRSVALLERGDAPGAKNVSGGVLLLHALREVYGEAAADAPLERVIVRHRLVGLDGHAAVALDQHDPALAEGPNAASVLRARLDPWLAQQAEDAGATLLTGVRVDALLTDAGTATGVRAGDHELTAHVVVAADGVNSFLTRGAGLAPPPQPEHLGLGVKAVVGLTPATLEDRFGVAPGQGAAWTITGCTGGVPGGGFVYTNRDSVSLGLVLNLGALAASELASADLFEAFIGHPRIAPLIDGGDLLEYSAHLVPEEFRLPSTRLTHDGVVVVGDAAGLALNTGLTLRGMDLALASGAAAAVGIDRALTRGDVSASGLAGYPETLLSGPIGRDLRTYARTPAFWGRARLVSDYPRLAVELLRAAQHHDGRPRRRLGRLAYDTLRGSGIRARDLAADLIAGVRAL